MQQPLTTRQNSTSNRWQHKINTQQHKTELYLKQMTAHNQHTAQDRRTLPHTDDSTKSTQQPRTNKETQQPNTPLQTYHITLQQFVAPNLIFPLFVREVRRPCHHAGTLTSPYEAASIVELAGSILRAAKLVEIVLSVFWNGNQGDDGKE